MYTTDCSSCIFNKNPEIGEPTCEMQRYNVFKRRGLITPEGLVNKLCTTCRNKEWEDTYKTNKYAQLYRELTNVYTLIIVDEEKDRGVLERLKKTLKSPQTVTPRQIIVAYHGEDSLSEISTYVQEYCSKKGIIYSVTKVLDQEYDRHIIDMCVKNVKGMFYLVQVNGQDLDKESFKKIYDYIENLLNTVLIITRNNGEIHGLAVSTLLHKKVEGNLGGFVEDKLKDMTKDSEQSLIKTWEDLHYEIIGASYE